MKSVTIILAVGLMLAASWAASAATSEPTSAATEPATAASTEPTTSTSEPATAPVSQPATAATTESATAPAQSPVAAMPANRSGAAKTPTVRPAATFDDYRIVFEKNVFLKDRTAPTTRRHYTPIRTTQPSQPAPHGLVLTGVAIREEIRLAFFEDDQTGELTKAVVGDVLPGGKLASISLDGVELDQGGKTRKVAIGEKLAGGGSVDMSAVHTSESTAGPAESSSSGDDILDRMKKRRAKELKP